MVAMKTLCLAACLLVQLPLLAKDTTHFSPELQISLSDGSLIKVHPRSGEPKLILPSGKGAFSPNWSLVREIEIPVENVGGKIHFKNGDRLTFQWSGDFLKADSSLGRLSIPVSEICEISVASATSNIALGKPVVSENGEAQSMSAAKHLTDGDPSTEAKPPASNFDFRIDLGGSFDVGRIVIDWGRFGDRFKGVPKEGGGWSSAAWPGEYVTSYVVEYRKAGSGEWIPLHSFDGRPAEEKGEGVEVLRLPTDQPGWSSVSTTTFDFPELENVTDVRIHANGSHWIGLQELEVHGRPAGR